LPLFSPEVEQDFPGLFPPQQLRHAQVIDIRVATGLPDGREAYPPARSLLSRHKAPPLWNQRDSLFQVLAGRDQCYSVKDRTVAINLGAQSVKSIEVALDLVACKMTIHNGDVRPEPSVLQS